MQNMENLTERIVGGFKEQKSERTKPNSFSGPREI